MRKIRLYGLVGYPVSHSYSPAMHNAAFKKLNINAGYFLFPVEPAGFKKGFKDILELGVSGLNVTVPFKEKVMPYLDHITRSARLIGSVNTVIIKGNRLFGDNTDGKGFVRAFNEDAGGSPEGRRIFMFGAGGAAKSVGFEMAAAGAREIAVCDIFEAKARKLASRIRKNTKCSAKAVSFKRKKDIASGIASADVLINATPRGMKKSDPPLVGRELLHKNLVVCDVIYNPAETPLLKDAGKKGLVAINGIGMLLYQGALAFRLWTGREAPLEAMKKALLARMPRPGR